MTRSSWVLPALLKIPESNNNGSHSIDSYSMCLHGFSGFGRGGTIPTSGWLGGHVPLVPPCFRHLCDTSATCISVSVDGSVCLFQIQTTVYNNNHMHGLLSTSVPVIPLGELMGSLKIVCPLLTLFVYSTYHFTSQNCALFLRKGQTLYRNSGFLQWNSRS